MMKRLNWNILRCTFILFIHFLLQDSKGYYIYTEANSQEDGDKARLISPVQEPGTYCFMFWYNMYGKDIGKLNVYTKPNTTTIFTQSGNTKYRNWNFAALHHNAIAKYQIVIEGIRGQGEEGDIAVDDVSLISGNCVDCTFDSGLCLWKQDTSDDFEWIRKRGATPSSLKGLLADHTSGGGYYIYPYISKERRNENTKARIISPLQKPGKYCFSFWYYMYGQHVDQKKKDYDDTIADGLTIIIEGRVISRNNHGVIAIDDVLAFPCQDCVNPAPLHGTTNSTNFQHGSAIEVICDSGYYLRGASSIVCQTGGTWSAYPTCDPVVCKNPKPTHGKANSTIFYYSSVIEVTCDEGFSVTGQSVISCQADGKWTDTTTCSLIDCGSKEIVNGEFRAVSGTTYGKTATQSCDKGYVLMGDAVVECIKSGWNGSAATCTIVDCLEPLTDNGMMSETTKRTTYNQTVEIVCVNGHKLLGNATVSCQANGNWTTLPICVIEDCLTPPIDNGMVAETKSTTFNKTIEIVCVNDYKLLGNATVTCQADGNWTTLPICVTYDSENYSALIAVYVLVPVPVVALVIALFVLIWRKNVIRCLPVSDANRKRDTKEQPYVQRLFSSVTYSDHQDEMQSNPGGALSQESEYATTMDEKNRKAQDENPVYNNEAGAVMAVKKKVKHNYSHMKTSATPVFDETYSNLSRDGGSNKSNYNTTSLQYPGHVSVRTNTTTENNCYDVLNYKDSKHSSGSNSHYNKKNDPYSEYDHAKAGGVDPVDLDDYSHLNDKTVKPVKSTKIELNMLDNVVYSSVVKSTKRNNKTNETAESVYEKAVGKTPQYYCDEAKTDGTGGDDRHYFVLEKV